AAFKAVLPGYCALDPTMQSVLSPDVDAFATPPTTPTVLTDQIRPSLSRRSSKPSNLHLQRASADWNPNIVLDLQQSPDPVPVKTGPSIAAQINGKLSANDALPPVMAPTPTITQQSDTPAAGPLRRAPSPPVTSPCFLHSKLQGASFKDWLHSKQTKAHQDARMDPTHGSHKLEANPLRVSYPDGTLSEPYSGHNSEYGADEGEDDGEDGEYALSLTKRLAETAVGVREMSKQLGRTCVHSHIQNVLIVTKARDNKLIKLTRELALYLMLKRRTGDRGMVVYVDSQLRTSRRFDAAGIERDHPQLFVPFPRRRSSSSSSVASGMQNGEGFLCSEGQLRYWTADMCSRSPHLFDFVVTLGGDGTVLFTSWLFQRIVPPVLPFALGSLGFLTNFDFADHQAVMDSAIDGGIRVNLRMRFTCTVYRAIAYDKARACRAIKKGDTGEILMRSVERGGWEALENGHQIHEGKSCTKDKEIMCFSTRPVESFEVLNDLVVDRGPSPYVSLLELFGDEHHLTTVQADGLTISTPTGSTAYSLSAGGSLVHPEIPAILITPICPHTLSFRPMLLPDTMELRICVPFNSRSTAWASFDGRGRVELKQGDHITVTASKYPFPTVCADTQSVDWFNSISRTLKWNERERQKSFVVVEENPLKVTARRESPEKSRHGQPTPTMRQHRLEKALRNVEDDEEEDEVSDEEEEKYDTTTCRRTSPPPQPQSRQKSAP
ncbi:NAD(+) kinase, partial [Grifola frondosa]